MSDQRSDASGPKLRRRARRRVLWSFAAIGVLVTGYFVGTFVQVARMTRVDDIPGPNARHAQAIIVLGAAQYNGVPSPVLRARLEHGLLLYQWKIAPVIVVTGGRQQGDKFTEATTGYNFLRAHGVPDSAIRKEVKGRTTWESVRAAATFLHAEGISDVVFVSDGYHAKRLLGIASEVGLTGRVSPSREPTSSATRIRAQVREAIAVGLGRIVGYRALDHR